MIMKKKVLTILACAFALCLGVVVLAGCSSSSSSSASSAASSDNADRTKLVVGFDQDFPPYGYVGDDGKFTGFDLDLAAEVASRNGWEIEYKPINWDAKDLELSSGSIDCIWNGFTIEGREDGYTFTDPYMDNSQVVVVRSDSGISGLSGLSGKTVLAQADSAAFALLSKGGDQETLATTFKSLQTTPDYNTAFMELESGAVDAVAIDQPVAKFQTSGKSTYTILSETLSAEHYGVGFLKGNTALRDQVQKTLKEMTTDGTVKKICEKYASQGISYEQWILSAN
jgi:polar amino acid transport system substrate-binding protein